MNVRLVTAASYRLVLALLLSFCVTPDLCAQNLVTLAWDASPDTDIAGYVVYWGTQPGVYSNSRDVGNITTQQVADLTPGRTYYFSVKAYNGSAQYSPASNEVSYIVPGTPPAEPPSIVSVAPGNGPTTGGTLLTITGTGFAGGITVSICGVPAANPTFINSGTVTAITPARAVSTCAVEVRNTDGLGASLANAFTYTSTLPTPASPTVTGVTPANGPSTGGTMLTITGANFTTGATVKVCGVAALSPNVITASTMTAQTAPGAVSTCGVEVVNPDGRSGTLANAFTYTSIAPTPVSPTVIAVAPGNGPTTGGTLLTISGTNFSTGAVVTVCGVPALNPTLVNSSTMTAQTAPRAVSNCTVQVVNPDGRSGSLANGFTYTSPTPQPEPPAPTLTAVAPATGPAVGGTFITLTGANFEAGATVSIGGTPATSVTFVNPSMVTAITPAATAGARTVTIVNPSGRSSSIASAFTYLDPPPPVPTDPEDLDGDRLPDAWERQYGLDPTSKDGTEGADGDPDSDGVTNIEEYRAGTHPRGFRAFTRYFAEGADSGFFDTRFSIMNPQATPARVRVEFMDQGGRTSATFIVMNPRSRTTITSKDVPAITGNAFSTKIESDVEIVADRYMSWGTKHYGSSAETGVKQPATRWFLAEGSTGGNFDLYYLLQNANADRADVQIRYLRGSGKPIVKRYTVEPFSRTTIHVDAEGSGLDWADVSADISVLNGVPIIVERSMYVSTPSELYTGGHESAAVEGTATEWFFAEGATGSFWSMYLLMMNPNDSPAKVTMTYMLADGSTVEKRHTIPANQRYTVGVNDEDKRLANASMSTRIVSTNGVGVVAERAMWWPSGAWYEGANVFGATSTGTKWGLAEGEQGGPDGNSTYVLVANTSPFMGRIRVTLLFEDRPEVSQEFTLEPTSRTNIQFGGMLKAAEGRRFSTLIESIGEQKAQIVVERAMYSSADGRLFSNGSAALGAKLQ